MKIKRQSPQRLRSSLCQGPAARLWIQEFESSLRSQAYRFFRERLRSRGKVRHLRGLGGGIRSFFRAELALRRLLARFGGPVSAAHFWNLRAALDAKPRPGSIRLETGS